MSSNTEVTRASRANSHISSEDKNISGNTDENKHIKQNEKSQLDIASQKVSQSSVSTSWKQPEQVIPSTNALSSSQKSAAALSSTSADPKSSKVGVQDQEKKTVDGSNSVNRNLSSKTTPSPSTEDGSKKTTRNSVAQPTTPINKIVNKKSQFNIKDIKLQRGLTPEDIDHCEKCGLGLWQPELRAPNLSLVMLNFVDMKNHPTNFTKLVHSTMTIFGIINLIRQETDIASSNIEVFKEKTKSTLLPVEKTLEECGFKGSVEWYIPNELTLYYDYVSDVIDCPLVEADYFLTQPKRKQNTSVL